MQTLWLVQGHILAIVITFMVKKYFGVKTTSEPFLSTGVCTLLALNCLGMKNPSKGAVVNYGLCTNK